MRWLIALFPVLLILIYQYAEYMGRQDLAIDLIEACVDARIDTRSCPLTYDIKNGDVTLHIGSKQVFCREGYGELVC